MISFVEAPSPREAVAGANASSTLRRLVRYLASALDVRYAFVTVSRESEGSLFAHQGLWLARDYGLRSEFAEIEVVAPGGEPGPRSVVAALRRAWPDEPSLLGLTEDRVLCLGLVAPDGRVIGHLGVLDPERTGRHTSLDSLRPLARTATAEAVRWAGV